MAKRPLGKLLTVRSVQVQVATKLDSCYQVENSLSSYTRTATPWDSSQQIREQRPLFPHLDP